MHERNYIDAKQAQAVRREMRRLISREYSRDATMKVLAEFEMDPNMQDGVDAEAMAREFVDRLRDLPDSQRYRDALQDLAACAYAEYKVEFQRGKIKRRGYRLSDSGAANLFAEKAREYAAESRCPQHISDGIDLFTDAARGRISYADRGWNQW